MCNSNVIEQALTPTSALAHGCPPILNFHRLGSSCRRQVAPAVGSVDQTSRTSSHDTLTPQAAAALHAAHVTVEWPSVRKAVLDAAHPQCRLAASPCLLPLACHQRPGIFNFRSIPVTETPLPSIRMHNPRAHTWGEVVSAQTLTHRDVGDIIHGTIGKGRFSAVRQPRQPWIRRH